MNFKEVELVGGPRHGIRVGDTVTFDSKTMVTVPLACIDDVTSGLIKDRRRIQKKILRDYEMAIKKGLFVSPFFLGLEELKKEEIVAKVLSVDSLLIDDRLIIIGKLKMMNTKTADRITRALKHDIVKVWFSPHYLVKGNKIELKGIICDS